MKTFFSPAGKSAHQLPEARSVGAGSQVSVHCCSCDAQNGELSFQGLLSKMAAASGMQQHSQAQRDDRGGKVSRQFPEHGGKTAAGKLTLYCLPSLLIVLCKPGSSCGSSAPHALTQVLARAREAGTGSLALKRPCTSGRGIGHIFNP